MPYLQHINHLLDLALTIVIFCMINQIIEISEQDRKSTIQNMSSNNWRHTRTSKDEIYDELGLHSLTNRRWRNKLIFFYKILNGLLPDYLHSYF